MYCVKDSADGHTLPARIESGNVLLPSLAAVEVDRLFHGVLKGCIEGVYHIGGYTPGAASTEISSETAARAVQIDDTNQALKSENLSFWIRGLVLSRTEHVPSPHIQDRILKAARDGLPLFVELTFPKEMKIIDGQRQLRKLAAPGLGNFSEH